MLQFQRVYSGNNEVTELYSDFHGGFALGRVHIIPLAKLSTDVCINTGKKSILSVWLRIVSYTGAITSCIIEMLEEEKNLKFIVTVDVTKIFSLLHLLVTVFRSFGSLTKIDRY